MLFFIVQTIHDVENLIKKEFNKRIFSYDWFIENDCHDLQLKCPIKIYVTVIISPRLSRPVTLTPQISYTDQNYY